MGFWAPPNHSSCCLTCFIATLFTPRATGHFYKDVSINSFIGRAGCQTSFEDIDTLVGRVAAFGPVSKVTYLNGCLTNAISFTYGTDSNSFTSTYGGAPGGGVRPPIHLDPTNPMDPIVDVRGMSTWTNHIQWVGFKTRSGQFFATYGDGGCFLNIMDSPYGGYDFKFSAPSSEHYLIVSAGGSPSPTVSGRVLLQSHMPTQRLHVYTPDRYTPGLHQGG